MEKLVFYNKTGKQCQLPRKKKWKLWNGTRERNSKCLEVPECSVVLIGSPEFCWSTHLYRIKLVYLVCILRLKWNFLENIFLLIWRGEYDFINHLFYQLMTSVTGSGAIFEKTYSSAVKTLIQSEDQLDDSILEKWDHLNILLCHPLRRECAVG